MTSPTNTSGASHAGHKSQRNSAVSHRPRDGHPLTWWRNVPPRFLGEPERLCIDNALRGLAVLGGSHDVAAALAGDSAAAIAATLSMAPLRHVTLMADIAMTALLSLALRGDPAAVLVLAHILGRAQWENSCAEDLGLAWLDRHTACPMDPKRFAVSEAAIAAAFCHQEE